MLLQCLQKAMAAVKPEMRFREVGDIISQHAQQQGFVPASTSTYGAITEWSLDGRAYNYAMICSSCTLRLRLLCKHLLPCKNSQHYACRFSVVKSYCGHGIGDLFHCAPSIPHYSHNKVSAQNTLPLICVHSLLCLPSAVHMSVMSLTLSSMSLKQREVYPPG